MLNFGSKFAFVPRQKQSRQVAVQYSDDALTDNLNEVLGDVEADVWTASPSAGVSAPAPEPAPELAPVTATTTSAFTSVPPPPPPAVNAPPPPSSCAPPPPPSMAYRPPAPPAKPAVLLQRKCAAPVPPPPPMMQRQQQQQQARRMPQQTQQPQQAATKVKHVRAVDTNVFTVKFGFLADGVELATGDPVFCTSCGACLSAIDKVAAEGGAVTYDLKAAGDSQQWKCNFCSTINTIQVTPEELPKTDIVDYVLQAPPPSAAGSAENTSLIFCIDISGSMGVSYEMEGKFKLRGDSTQKLSGLNTERSSQYLPNQRRETTWVSRLQTLQAAICSHIDSLAKQHPDRTVGIIAFSNEVTVIGDGASAPVTIAGDKLDNYDELVRCAAELKLATPISKAKEAIVKKLFELEENGQTALGPSLVVAATLAAQKRGSEVVVCTDGLANKGVGSMEFMEIPETRTAVEKFYETVGLTAKTNGVTISVLSIKGSEAGVEHLGTVADATGGTINMIEPTELTKNFSTIFENPVIATHVSAKIILHQGLCIHGDDGREMSQMKEDIGNVTGESECTFEYGTRSSFDIPDYDKLEFLPFQVQVEYTKLDGMKCVRVISHKQPITRELDHAIQDANIEVLGVNAVRAAAKSARAGDYTGARFTNFAHRQLISKAAKPQQQAQFAQYLAQNEMFEERLQQAQAREIVTEGGVLDDAETDEHDPTAAQRRVSQMQRRQANREDEDSRVLWGAKNMNSKRMYKKT